MYTERLVRVGVIEINTIHNREQVQNYIVLEENYADNCVNYFVTLLNIAS
jgi:hypothetical protein